MVCINNSDYNPMQSDNKKKPQDPHARRLVIDEVLIDNIIYE